MLDLLKSYQDRGLTLPLNDENATTEVVELSAPESTGATGVVSCKFVVLANSSHYLLIFGDVQKYPYHANVLDAYSQQIGLARHWIKQPDQLHLDDPQFRLLGGGYLDLDRQRRKVRISGSSKAYGFFDSEAVRLIVKNSSFFAEFAVSVEY